MAIWENLGQDFPRVVKALSVHVYSVGLCDGKDDFPQNSSVLLAETK